MSGPEVTDALVQDVIVSDRPKATIISPSYPGVAGNQSFFATALRPCEYRGSEIPHLRQAIRPYSLIHVKDKGSGNVDADHNEPGADAGGKGDVR